MSFLGMLAMFYLFEEEYSISLTDLLVGPLQSRPKPIACVP
jgi:hypothetical protein